MLLGGSNRGIHLRERLAVAAAEVTVRRNALIMAVDDDATSRAAIIDALEGHGYRVFAVSSYEAWSTAWRSGPVPDLLVLDIMLSERRGGYEILRALRQEDKKTPVVMVSSRNTSSDTAFALANQANGFVSKVREAFDHPENGLVATVNRLLST